jgi:large subunit ribosomal protein L17
MRHLKAGRKLGRNATHRLALMRNLTRALIENERIITTLEKAKEARRFVEKLITLAKKGTLHARRIVIARLGPVGKADLYEVVEQEGRKVEVPTGDSVVQKLFNDIAPRFADRPGGYTRVIKRHERRLGDAGHTAYLELLKEGETKVRARTPASAPAPRVTETTAPSEKPAETSENKPSEE